MSTGKVVVSNDEWTLGDAGFEHASDTGTYATNVASWFTGGRPGRFLIYSTNFGVTQTRFISALRDAGHTLVTKSEFSSSFTAASLASFEGVFVAGNSADNQVLIDYVEAGGAVYLAGGTGVSGSARAEAATWATFLNHFDLRFADVYNQIGGNQAIADDHPVFRGVSELYEVNGNTIELTDANSQISRLVSDSNHRGLYAITDLANRLSFECRTFTGTDENDVAGTLSQVTGDAGPQGESAIHLNGAADSFVSFGTEVGQFGTADFTVMFWLKTGETLRLFDLVGNRTAGSHGDFFCIRMTGHHESMPMGEITVEIDQNGANYIYIGSTRAGLNDERWHHVATTRQGATMKLYIDGALAGQGSASGAANVANGNPFKVGRSLVGVESNFTPNASFADLRVYDRALPAQDIAPISLTPDLAFGHLWAGTAQDVLGDTTLQALGSPAEGRPVSGLADTPLSDKAFEFSAETRDGWSTESADIGDFADESVLIAGLFRTTAGKPTSGLLGLVGKRDRHAPHRGWDIGLDPKGEIFALVGSEGGVRESLIEVGHQVADGAWHVFVAVFDKANNRVSMHTDEASGNAVTIPGACSSAHPMEIGACRLRSAAAQIAFVATAKGPRVTEVDPQALAASLRAKFVHS